MLMAMMVRMGLIKMVLGDEKMLIIANLTVSRNFLVTLVTLMKFIMLYG